MWPAIVIAREPLVRWAALAGLLLVLAAVSAAPRGARLRRALAAGTALSVLMIGAVTLYPTGSGAPAFGLCARTLAGAATEPVPRTGEALLNVLLFVPAGIGLVLTSRRVVLPLVGLTALSGLIELAQGGLGRHSCTGADLKANTLGAIIGIATGFAVLRVQETSSSR